jgi:hypothetical protein
MKIGTVFLGIWVLMQIVLLEINTRKNWKTNNVLQDKFTFEFSDSGIKIFSDNIDTFMDWSKFKYYKENKKLFLLYHNKNYFTMIPKNWIKDINPIKSVLLKNINKYKLNILHKVLLIFFPLLVLFFSLLTFSAELKINDFKIINSTEFKINTIKIFFEKETDNFKVYKNIESNENIKFNVLYNNKISKISIEFDSSDKQNLVYNFKPVYETGSFYVINIKNFDTVETLSKSKIKPIFNRNNAIEKQNRLKNL